jgi:rhamnose transport system ATP-binding protein
VLFDDLTVAENIFLGHAPRSRFGTIDWTKMRARTRRSTPWARPHRRRRAAARTGIANKHLVAVARALSIDAEIVIMDEPTAALSHKEIEELFVLIEAEEDGKAILFISHKFDEIYRIADRYTVFRDGEMVGEGLLRGHDAGRDRALMVGRSVDQIFPERDVEIGEPVLSVSGLSHPDRIRRHLLRAAAGEILGFYGLVGAGRSEVMQALFGITRPSAAPWPSTAADRALRPPTPSRPASSTCRRNAAGRASSLDLPIFRTCRCPRSGEPRARASCADREFALTREYTERLDLRASSLSQEVGTLSGGNQQKVVIAKWLATQPKVIILDEPTKGIDIGSKAAVHDLHGRTGRRGAVRHHGLVRTARDPRHERPHRRDARGPHRGTFDNDRASTPRHWSGRRRHRGTRRMSRLANPRGLAGARHRRS